MKVTKLSDVMGVSVEDFDLSQRLTMEQERALFDLYNEHGLLVFRDQKLTKQQLRDAAMPFGGAMIDPPATVRDPDVPGIVVISTRGTQGDVMPEDPDALVGDLPWHTDQGYVPAPNRGKFLYAVQVPEAGGMTGFIDLQLAYKALPDAMKQRIDGLHVIQSWDRSASYLARNAGYRIGGDQQLVPGKFPDLVYPLVYAHPYSGEKILNVVPLWDAGIVELPGSEGDALLEELTGHVMDPQFMHWHSYRPGDAVIWDNWRQMHASSGTPGRYARTMWSVAIQAGPEFGRPLREDETLACRVSKLYLDYVMTQNVQGLRDIFAEGCDYIGPDGTGSNDKFKIGEGYAQGFANMGDPWIFQFENAVPFGANGCFLEFGTYEEKEGRFILSALDHIEVNEEGKISRFIPFFSSNQIPKVLGNINRHKAHA